MHRGRSLCFDALEERKLLSRGHVVAHAKHAVAATPLVLNGTLTVDNAGATSSMDEFEDTTTSIPVAGQLGTLGKVRGTWNESVDSEGDYLGPDTIQLHNAKGSFVVEFNADSPGPLHRISGGAVYYQHPQLVSGGMRAYARTKESGSIDLNTNPAHTVIESMTISTQTS
jgi:hypothetical protein